MLTLHLYYFMPLNLGVLPVHFKIKIMQYWAPQLLLHLILVICQFNTDPSGPPASLLTFFSSTRCSLQSCLLHWVSIKTRSSKIYHREHISKQSLSSLSPCPCSLLTFPWTTPTSYFVIVYIILSGLIDSMVPAADTWSWFERSVLYLFKLAPILWWALPAWHEGQVWQNSYNNVVFIMIILCPLGFQELLFIV